MFCPKCGAENQNGAAVCTFCHVSLSPVPPHPQAAPFAGAQYPAPPQQPTAPASSDPLTTLIPYKNSYALIAYYLAVFSLIPGIGLILGIAAFFLGLTGLKCAKEHPEFKGKGHALVGIILGGLCGWGSVVGIIALIILSQSHR